MLVIFQEDLRTTNQGTGFCQLRLSVTKLGFRSVLKFDSLYKQNVDVVKSLLKGDFEYL